ncbi:uncharacterized protein [Euphorbia lathyris]|uniref:uncharacterized protein n=1 Tax=Euphorbia lathyris TaxID=212925 RepID=UPI00331404BD
MMKREITIDPWEIKSQVWKAMCSCINHIKEQADSLTFEGIRTLLEKDLGLEKYALDKLIQSVRRKKFQITKAMLKRDSYIKANCEEVTTIGLCRILEEDIGLNKFALYTYKKYISNLSDEVLLWVDENLESSDKEIDEDDEDEDEVKPKKKISAKQKIQNSEVSKKRKRLEKEIKASSKKQNKLTEEAAKDNGSAERTENGSNDSCSQSFFEQSVKKNEVSTPTNGKDVEHMIIKHVPENKREAKLIKELKEIFFKEGLSSNASEKEIKEVKKKKERVKELEGIDMSNIVSSSPRSFTSYVPHPKPKIPVYIDNSDDEKFRRKRWR